MITDRSYRPGRSVTEAAEELDVEGGRRFDPPVVEALAVLAERPWR